MAERDDINPVDIICIKNGIATHIPVKILHPSGVAVRLGGIPFNAFNCTGYLCLDNWITLTEISKFSSNLSEWTQEESKLPGLPVHQPTENMVLRPEVGNRVSF